jgi:hypothetical protein
VTSSDQCEASQLSHPNNDCPGIAIEHLTLNGNSQSNVNGIVSLYGQELSYVQDVKFSAISGTALSLSASGSNNSGPYSNLTMSGVGTCVSINAPIGTRGIHGLNCSISGTGPAIDVEGSNSSLEDISLTGTTGTSTDGILIGNSVAALNNVLFNVNESGFSNLIHISNNSANNQNECPGKANSSTTAYNACDITIMGVSNSSGNTIYDQVSVVTLNSNLGMYVLGEPVQYGDSNGTNDQFLGNSHFTTSPNWPSWVAGTSSPSGSCSNVGSLYSVTSGTNGTLWECETSVWVKVY